MWAIGLVEWPWVLPKVCQEIALEQLPPDQGRSTPFSVIGGIQNIGCLVPTWRSFTQTTSRNKKIKKIQETSATRAHMHAHTLSHKNTLGHKISSIGCDVAWPGAAPFTGAAMRGVKGQELLG